MEKEQTSKTGVLIFRPKQGGAISLSLNNFKQIELTMIRHSLDYQEIKFYLEFNELIWLVKQFRKFIAYIILE